MLGLVPIAILVQMCQGRNEFEVIEIDSLPRWSAIAGWPRHATGLIRLHPGCRQAASGLSGRSGKMTFITVLSERQGEHGPRSPAANTVYRTLILYIQYWGGLNLIYF